MPIDIYSLCPGGTGKKVKFCCSDLTGELEKLSKMFEGEQYLAGLRYIERLEEKFPGRACLMAIKAEVLDSMNNVEGHRATASRFLDLHPKNPLAHAEVALALAESDSDPRLALNSLLRSFALMADTMLPRIYAAIEPVAIALLESGFFSAARALLTLRYTVGGHEREGLDALTRLNGLPSVPLVVKQEPAPKHDPGDVPWRAEFERAMEPLAHVRWRDCQQLLAELAEKVGDSAPLWRNLATIREWLADTQGAADALRRYAALCSSPEDAAEALAVASLMANPPVGDRRDLYTLEYEVTNPDEFTALMTAAPLVIQVPLDPEMLAQMPQPRPRAGYLLIDRPQPAEINAETRLDDIPSRLAQFMFFGRETDRPARLVVMSVSADKVDAVRASLAGMAGTVLDTEHVTQNVAGTQPAMAAIIQFDWFLMRISAADHERLAQAHLRQAIHDRWTRTPWEVLDGKTPVEAASQPEHQTRLMAAVVLLDCWLNYLHEEFDLNPLREQLGLPALGPVEPPATIEEFDSVPLTRLARVEAERLSDELLVFAMQKASVFQALRAMRKFATAVLDRPSLHGKGESLVACRYLVMSESSLAVRMETIDKARSNAEAAGGKVGMYRLLELSLLLTHGLMEQAQAVLELLQTRHIQEPGVAEGVMSLLMQLGIIRPDGSMARPAGPPPAAATASGVVVPDAVPGAEPGKLWVPGAGPAPPSAPAQQPPGSKPSGLWVPD